MDLHIILLILFVIAIAALYAGKRIDKQEDDNLDNHYKQIGDNNG
jgi:hypothetical protein